MKKKIIVGIISFIFIVTGSILISKLNTQNLENETTTTNNIEAVVLYQDNETITIQDNNNIIYTLAFTDEVEIGTTLVIEYTGSLNKNIQLQEIKIVDYSKKTKEISEDGINTEWLDDGIFSDYYTLANKKLQTMTLDEKIAQLFLVRYPDDATSVSIQQKYQFAGYVFFAKDFASKTELEVKNMINNVQQVSKIPMLTAVDEEGGSIVRISSNSNLATEPFKSPS